ncbi:hypothetical protein ACWCO3_31410, partial [Micromonospora sp. NPDC002411]
MKKDAPARVTGDSDNRRLPRARRAGAALATAPARVEVVFAAEITSGSTVTIRDHTGKDRVR